MNDSVNTSVANFVRAALDQAHGNHENMTPIPFNPTLGFIAIDPSVTKVEVLSPAIGHFFAEGVFSIPQACAYPISGTEMDQAFWVTADEFIAGQYGFLNRVLYYCLILFAVLAASKSWLCWVRTLCYRESAVEFVSRDIRRGVLSSAWFPSTFKKRR